jgi:hypothetical protein
MHNYEKQLLQVQAEGKIPIEKREDAMGRKPRASGWR